MVFKPSRGSKSCFSKILADVFPPLHCVETSLDLISSDYPLKFYVSSEGAAQWIKTGEDMNADKYKLSFLVDTGITSLWVCVSAHMCVCWEMWHIRKVVLLLRSFTHTRSHTHILNPEFTYTNTHSCTKWGWICGYYGNHVKVAGEFNSTVETGRDRERRNMKEYGGGKNAVPPRPCVSRLGFQTAA